MIETKTSNPLKIYLISTPRTGSNLFCKLFSEHPAIEQTIYQFLFEHFFGPEAQLQMQGEESVALQDEHRIIFKDATYQAALDALQERFVKANSSVSSFLRRSGAYSDA